MALYAELDEKADFLRRASEMKSRFLSNMSHEFRTPLECHHRLDLALARPHRRRAHAEQEKQVTLIRRAAEGLTELVNDLLDLAKVEAGKVTIQPIEFEVQTLFGALRGMLRPLLAHNSSVSLVFEDCDHLPTLHTDETKVSQILRNFTSNALKFTQEGEVRVSAAAPARRHGRLHRVRYRHRHRAGRPAANLRGIYSGRRPAPEAREGDRPGPPAGEEAGRPPGRSCRARQASSACGSSFSAVLPRVYQGPLDPTTAPELTTQIDPKRRPVLVVEDNPETLFIYEKYLKGSGYQVIPARTLHAARRALAQFVPVAVVLDVLLEGESTWELLEELKRARATREDSGPRRHHGRKRSQGESARCRRLLRQAGRPWLAARATWAGRRARPRSTGPS